MTLAGLVWVIDTSSICEIRRSTMVTVRGQVFEGLTALVNVDRLIYPRQVVDELERRADPADPDQQFTWAATNSLTANDHASCDLNEVKSVLAIVPEVLDPTKDSGADEADPYVLAVALRLRNQGVDARIVTEERRDTPSKLSLSTAAGILGIPSVPLTAFLRAENIPTRTND